MPRVYRPYKRVYYEKVAKWLGGTGIAVGLALFYYLVVMGAIQVTGHSGDIVCAGTINDPCYAYINFTTLKDVYIYPNELWMFDTNPAVEKIILQRRWGTYWRTINLSKPWSKKVKYAVKFSMGKSYQIRFVGYKKYPFLNIKWSFGDIDPWWNSSYDYRYEIQSNSTEDIVINVNDTNSPNFWTLNASAGEDVYLYCENLGCATGDIAIGNETDEKKWENESCACGNSVKSMWVDKGASNVWHLHNISGWANDSASGNDGFIYGGTEVVTGVFGDGVNKTSLNITIGTAGLPTGSTNRTNIAWIKCVQCGGTNIMVYGSPSGRQKWNPAIDVNHHAVLATYDNDFTSSFSVDTNTWNLLGYMYNGTHLILIKVNSSDFILEAQATIALATSNNAPRKIAIQTAGSAIYDEIRMYNETKSTSWFQEQYYLGIDNLTSLEAEETRKPPAIYLNGSNSSVYYELDSTANLTAYSSGTVCISLNLTGYENINCSTDSVEYIFDTMARTDRVSEATSLNKTSNSTLTFGSGRSYTNLTFNIRGWGTNWTYQENASFVRCTGTWNTTYNCSNTYDNDWDTYGFVNGSSPSGETAYIYLNYTKPGNAISAIWEKKSGYPASQARKNLTILSDCFDQSILRLRVKSFRSSAGNGPNEQARYECYDGSNWQMLWNWYSDVGPPDIAKIYEEGIWWEEDDIYGTFPKNITFDWDNDGTFDLWYPGIFNGSTFYVNETDEGNKTFNLTYTAPQTQSFDIILPANVTIELANLTIYGFGGTKYYSAEKDFNTHHSDSTKRFFGYRHGGKNCPDDTAYYSATEFSNNDYEKIWSDDATSADSSHTAATGMCLYHYFRYYVSEPEGRINNITLRWNGDVDSPFGASENVWLKAWDYDDNEWDLIASGTGVGNLLLEGSVTNYTKYKSNNWVQYAVMFDSSGDSALHSDFSNATVNMNISYPANITIDTGFDGDTDYNWSDELNSTNSPLNIDINVTELQEHINVTVGKWSTISVGITSEATGIIQVQAIDIRYNLTDQAGFSGVNVTDTLGTVKVVADTWGKIEVSDVYGDFLGDIDYNVSSNDTWHYLFVRWSNMSLELPYTWTDDLLWFADSNSTKNLAPWKQSSTTPILSVNSTDGDNISVYVKSPDLDSCLNLSISNTSNVTDGIVVNSSFQRIFENVTTGQLWLEVNLTDCSGRWSDFNLTFDPYCMNCSWWY